MTEVEEVLDGIFPEPMVFTNLERPTAPQTRRVLEMLEMSDWVCGGVFLRSYMSRYSARIYELREAGWPIYSEVCPTEAHQHRGQLFRFRLGQ